MADPPVDLFGVPVRAPRPPGRPLHEPTDELRRRVIDLRAQSLSQQQISAALGITEPTLRRHYLAELDTRPKAFAHWRRRPTKETQMDANNPGSAQPQKAPEAEQIEQGAIAFAAHQFVATLAPALAALPASIRLHVLDWTLIELSAREVGPLGLIEHLRLLADVVEEMEIDKRTLAAQGQAN